MTTTADHALYARCLVEALLRTPLAWREEFAEAGPMVDDGPMVRTWPTLARLIVEVNEAEATWLLRRGLDEDASREVLVTALVIGVRPVADALAATGLGGHLPTVGVLWGCGTTDAEREVYKTLAMLLLEANTPVR